MAVGKLKKDWHWYECAFIKFGNIRTRKRFSQRILWRRCRSKGWHTFNTSMSKFTSCILETHRMLSLVVVRNIHLQIILNMKESFLTKFCCNLQQINSFGNNWNKWTLTQQGENKSTEIHNNWILLKTIG